MPARGQGRRGCVAERPQVCCARAPCRLSASCRSRRPTPARHSSAGPLLIPAEGDEALQGVSLRPPGRPDHAKPVEHPVACLLAMALAGVRSRHAGLDRSLWGVVRCGALLCVAAGEPPRDQAMPHEGRRKTRPPSQPSPREGEGAKPRRRRATPRSRTRPSINKTPTTASRRTYCRAPRTFPATSGPLLRNGLISNPPRRV
jgi:hypothetical protein